ncbi:MAG: hypothetical protein MMC23_006714 [Stictis urceolatum]|nr:hypothetical protein [Stictis urceolata]
MPPKRKASTSSSSHHSSSSSSQGSPNPPATTDNPPKPSPSLPLNPLTYPYTPTEKLVLTLEPYKSALLPHWRFKTASIARTSSAALWERFLAYETDDDFVGMDMARKFIQMGMTRAKRYANHAGGRKYARAEDGGRGEELARSEGHEGREEKEEASLVFREVWERCKAHGGYVRRKEEWVEEGRRLRKEARKGGGGGGGKGESGKSEAKQVRGKPEARRQRKTTRRKTDS